MVEPPEDYIWSSYRSYIDLNPAPDWLRLEGILAYFGQAANAKSSYRTFVEVLLGSEYESPLRETFGTAMLGTEGFVAMIAETQVAAKGVDRAVPGLLAFASRPEPEAIWCRIKRYGREQKAVQAGGDVSLSPAQQEEA